MPSEQATRDQLCKQGGKDALRRAHLKWVVPDYRGVSLATGPGELLSQFTSQFARDRHFGYRLDLCGGKFPPLTTRQAQVICSLAHERYWQARLCTGSLERSKECLRAVAMATEAAALEYRASKEKPSKIERIRQFLLDRDGSDCWVCGHELGDNMTIEHKVARANGGTWAFGNLALAHIECNRALARLPLAAKEAVRALAEREQGQ